MLSRSITRLRRALKMTVLGVAGAAAAPLDLSQAVLVAAPGFTRHEQKAVSVLVEEVEKRTLIRWPMAAARPASGAPSVVLQRGAQGGPAEGFRIRTHPGGVEVTGNDARGLLFGVGHLLRSLSMEQGSVKLPEALNLTTAPKYSLRGHQLGYRPKTNSYDGWNVPMWDQYIRDLAVFGANAIELLPPRSDDATDSPHFPLPPMPMMIEMSRIAGSYGLDVWIWYPALDKDYSDPNTVESALKEWGEVFRQLPRIDAVMVPGGDPGHTQPKVLMALLEKQTQVLRRYHPKAAMWVSPQGFSQEWLEEFYGLLRQQPAWLAGVVYGPQVRVSLEQLRRGVPPRYAIRNYPDITHSRHCQHVVPEWDAAFQLTLGREPINPRPRDMAAIFRRQQPHTIGFLAYSEGSNDDVNKTVWSALGWSPDAEVVEILRQYGRYFIGARYADTFAQGLLALERNWRGPLAANAGVYATLAQFQTMEREASPQDRLNWRFQQALYRAYYDAHVRRRLIAETAAEEQALDRLREAPRRGTLTAMAAAEAILDRAAAQAVAPEWRTRIFQLAEALFQSNRMQLSVERYAAIARDRGATLDSLETPLNNRGWLKARFAGLRQLSSEAERLRGLEAIVNWSNPGPGGFYDDLGNPAQQPHLVRGPAYEEDPDHLRRPLLGIARQLPDADPWRASSITTAETMYDAPLEMHYRHLHPAARYRLRVIYGGERSAQRVMRLLANEKFEIHAYRPIERLTEPLEFDIPPEATAGGELRLKWTKTPGAAGSGRGCQVAEVWLIRK